MVRYVVISVILTACAGPTTWEVGVFEEARISVGGVDLGVAVADTATERRRGLTGVEELPEGIDGMLFVFPEAAPVNFHMLETPLPLDIWWFDDDGVLLGATAMEPCPSKPCLSYPSPGPVRWALETPQGRYRLEVGELLSVNSG
jgi:uncharacterized membrane protein (UPF0127 family)